MTLLKFGTRLLLYALPDNMLSCLKVLCHAALYSIQYPRHFSVLLSIYTGFYKILYIKCAISTMSPLYCMPSQLQIVSFTICPPFFVTLILIFWYPFSKLKDVIGHYGRSIFQDFKINCKIMYVILKIFIIIIL